MPQTKWLEKPHVQQLVAEGIVKPMPSHISLSFWHHIERHYPLVPVIQDSIDWPLVQHGIRILWTQASDAEVLQFIRSTRLGTYDKVIAYYTQWDPCLFCTLPVIVNLLDTVFRTAHHAVYLFGVEEREDDIHKFFFDDFVELDLDDEMWLSGIKQ